MRLAVEKEHNGKSTRGKDSSSEDLRRSTPREAILYASDVSNCVRVNRSWVLPTDAEAYRGKSVDGPLLSGVLLLHE